MDYPGHVRKKASTEISFAEYGKPPSDDEEPTKENKRVIDLVDPLDAMSLNSDQSRVVVAGMRGVLQIIKIFNSAEDIAEGPSIVKDIDLRTRARGKINILYSANNVSWNKVLDQNVATTSSNGSIVVWNVARKNKMIYKSHERSATCLDWSGNEPHLLISGSRDCHVYAYDIRSPDMHQQVYVEGTCEAVRDLEFVKHPGLQQYFFTGDDSGALRLWDLRQTRTFIFQRTAHNSFVSTISVNPNERNLLATGGGRDKLIKVWDWSGNEIERRYVVETMAPLGRCMWRPDKPFQIASCSSVNDMNVHVWDIRRPFIPYSTYDEHKDSVTDACWLTAGQECFMSCGKDGLIVLHAIDSGHAPITYACDVPFDVTPDGVMGIAVNSELHSKVMAEMEPLPIAVASRPSNSNRSLMVRQQKIKKIAYELFRGPVRSIVTCGIPDTLQISLPPVAFYELARKYWLGGRTLRVICRHNSKAAKAAGKDHVAQTWRLVEALIAQANLQEIYDQDAIEWKKDFDKKWAVMKKELANEGKRILPNIHELNKASLARINADRLESTSMVNEFSRESDNESEEEAVESTKTESEESDVYDSENSEYISAMRQRKKQKKKTRQRTSSSADFYFGGGESNFRMDSKKKENLHLNEFMGLRDEAFELRFKDKKLFCDANKSVEEDDFSWSPMMEILRLLQYHSEQGDVQTCASVAIVCGRKLFDVIDTYTVGAWIDCYMDMCDRLELFVTNARIKKYCAIHRINQMSREGTNIELVHSECEKPIKNGRCTKCEKLAAPMCTACHEPVTGLMSECHICRHVMHPQHALKWFKNNRYCCATDCLCPCPKSEYPYIDRYYLEADDLPIDFTEFNNRPKVTENPKKGNISKLRIHAVDYGKDSREGRRILELTPRQKADLLKYTKEIKPSITLQNAVKVMKRMEKEERKARKEMKKKNRKNEIKEVHIEEKHEKKDEKKKDEKKDDEEEEQWTDDSEERREYSEESSMESDGEMESESESESDSESEKYADVDSESDENQREKEDKAAKQTEQAEKQEEVQEAVVEAKEDEELSESGEDDTLESDETVIEVKLEAEDPSTEIDIDVDEVIEEREGSEDGYEAVEEEQEREEEKVDGGEGGEKEETTISETSESVETVIKLGREKKVYPKVTSGGECIRKSIRDLVDSPEESSESEDDFPEDSQSEKEDEEKEKVGKDKIEVKEQEEEDEKEVEFDGEAIEEEEYGEDAELAYLADVKQQYCLKYVDMQRSTEMENDQRTESACSQNDSGEIGIETNKDQLISEEEEELDRLMCKSQGEDFLGDRKFLPVFVNEVDNLGISESMGSTSTDSSDIDYQSRVRKDIDTVALAEEIGEIFHDSSDDEKEEKPCHSGTLGCNSEGIPFSEIRKDWPESWNMRELAKTIREKKEASKNEFVRFKAKGSKECFESSLKMMGKSWKIQEEAREDAKMMEEFVKVYFFIPWKDLLKPGSEVLLRDVYDMCDRFKVAKRRTCETHYLDFLFKFYANTLATRIRGLWLSGLNYRTNEDIVHSMEPGVKDRKIRQFEKSLAYNFPTDWATLKPCCRSFEDNDDFEDLLDLDASVEKDWSVAETEYANQYWNMFGKVPLEVKTTEKKNVTVIGSKSAIKMDGSRIDLVKNEKLLARKRILKMAKMRWRRQMMRYKPVKKAEWQKGEKLAMKKMLQMDEGNKRKKGVILEKFHKTCTQLHKFGVLRHNTEEFIKANPQEDWTGSQIYMNGNSFVSYHGNDRWPIVRIHERNRVVDIQPVIPKLIVQLKSRLRNKFSNSVTYKLPITDRVYGEKVTHVQKKRDYKSKFVQRSEKFDYFSYVRQSGPFKKFVSRFMNEKSENLYHKTLEYDEAAGNFVYKRILGTIIEENEQQLFWNMVKMKAKGDTRVIDEKLEKIENELRMKHYESQKKKYQDYIKDEKKQEIQRMNIMNGTWIPKFKQQVELARRAIQKGKLLIEKDVQKWMVFEYHLHEHRKEKAIRRRKERALRRRRNMFGIDLKNLKDGVPTVEQKEEAVIEEIIECDEYIEEENLMEKVVNYDTDTDTSEGTIPTSPDDDQSISSWFDEDEDHINERLAFNDYVDEMRVLAERTKGPLQDKQVLRRYYSNENAESEEDAPPLSGRKRRNYYREADLQEGKLMEKRRERRENRTKLYQTMKNYLGAIKNKENLNRNDPLICQFIKELHREELRRVSNRLKIEMKTEYQKEQNTQHDYDCLLPRYITDSEYTELIDMTFSPSFKYQEVFEALVLARRMVVPVERYESIFGKLGIYSIEEVSDELIECHKTREAICWIMRNEKCPDTIKPREWVKQQLNVLWPASRGKLDEYKQLKVNYDNCRSSNVLIDDDDDSISDFDDTNPVEVEMKNEIKDKRIISDLLNKMVSRVEEFMFEMDSLVEEVETSKDRRILRSIQYHDYRVLNHLKEADIEELKEKKEDAETIKAIQNPIEMPKCQFKIGSFESEPSIISSEGALRRIVEEKKEDIESGEETIDSSSYMDSPSENKKIVKSFDCQDSHPKYLSKSFQRTLDNIANEPEELIVEDNNDCISTEDESDLDENDHGNGKWVEYFEGDEELSIEEVMDKFGVARNANMKYYTFEFHKFDKVVFGEGDVKKIRKMVEDYVEEYEDSDGVVYEEEVSEDGEDSNDDAISYKSMKHVMRHEIYFQREVPGYRVPSCVVMFNPNQFFKFWRDEDRIETDRWQRIIELTTHQSIFTILAMRERLIKDCRNAFFKDILEKHGDSANIDTTVDNFKNCLILVVVDTRMKPWVVNIISSRNNEKKYKPSTRKQYLRWKMLKDSRINFTKWKNLCCVDEVALSNCPVIEVDDKPITLRSFLAMQDSVIHDEVVDDWHVLTKEQGIRALDAMIQMKATPPSRLPLMKKIYRPIYDSWYEDWNVWRKQQNRNVVYMERVDPIVVAEYQFKLVTNYAYQYYRMIKYDPVLSKTRCKDFSIRFPTFRQDVPSSALLSALRQSMLEFINVGSKPLSEARRKIARATIINIAHHGNPNDPRMYQKSKKYDDDELFALGGSVDDLRSSITSNNPLSDPNLPECYEEVNLLRSKHEARDMHRRRFMAQMLFEITQRTLYRTCPQIANFTLAKEKFDQLLTKHAVQRPLLDMMLTKVDGLASMSDEEKKFLLEHKLISEEDLNEPDSDDEPVDSDDFEPESEDSDEEESESDLDRQSECFSDEDEDSPIMKVSFNNDYEDDEDDDIAFLPSRDGSNAISDKIDMFTPSITKEAQPSASYSPVSSFLSSSPFLTTSDSSVEDSSPSPSGSTKKAKNEKDKTEDQEEEEEIQDEKTVMGKRLWERKQLLARHFGAIASLDKKKIEDRIGGKLGKDKLERLTNIIQKNCDTAHDSWGPLLQMTSRKRMTAEQKAAERKRILEEQKKSEKETGKKFFGTMKKYDITNPKENGSKYF